LDVTGFWFNMGVDFLRWTLLSHCRTGLRTPYSGSFRFDAAVTRTASAPTISVLSCQACCGDMALLAFHHRSFCSFAGGVLAELQADETSVPGVVLFAAVVLLELARVVSARLTMFCSSAWLFGHCRRGVRRVKNLLSIVYRTFYRVSSTGYVGAGLVHAVNRSPLRFGISALARPLAPRASFAYAYWAFSSV